MATNCVKISLIIFNVFFWLLGLGILGLGIWIKVDQNVVNFSEAVQVGTEEKIVEIITWIFIGTGIFVFCVGFFGCCGAVRESKAMLGFYMTCIVIVFAAEIGAGIYAAVKKEPLKEQIKKTGSEWIKTSYDDQSSISKGLNYVQLQFCCCGINNFWDYVGSEFVKNAESLKDGAYMSFACCKPTNEITKETVEIEISAEGKELCMASAIQIGKQYNQTTPLDLTQSKYKSCDSTFRAQGCVENVVEWAEENMVLILIVGIVVGVLQLIGFVLACCLCRMIGLDEKMT